MPLSTFRSLTTTQSKIPAESIKQVENYLHSFKESIGREEILESMSDPESYEPIDASYFFGPEGDSASVWTYTLICLVLGGLIAAVVVKYVRKARRQKRYARKRRHRR